MKLQPYKIVLISLALFVTSSMASYGLSFLFPDKPIWLPQVILKCILLTLSLLSISFIIKVSWRNAGFKKPLLPIKKSKVILSGLLPGATATGLIFVTPAQGYSLIKQMSLLQFFLIIVFWSSIVEEIFIRGFLQTGLGNLKEKRVRVFGYYLSQSVLICALVFAGIHLSLLFVGVDYWTVFIIVSSTFSLGLFAGYYKEKYDSIFPSILVHIFFNVGGIAGGIIIAILNKLITGAWPLH